jgi:hypothetical protein
MLVDLRLDMTQFKRVCFGCWLAVAIFLGVSSIGETHSGLVDGYGCHRGPDKVSYHCHQGQFAGRTFKSKEDFLRELRGGKSPQLTPKNNPPQPERKPEK